MSKPLTQVHQAIVGLPPDPHECVELRAELAAQARDIQRMAAEIARLRPIERAAREALALAYQGRAQDAYDVLNNALAGRPSTSLYRRQPCCSPESGI